MHKAAWGAALAALAGLGWPSATLAGPAGNTVVAVFPPFTYSPTPVHVAPGEALTFYNFDAASGEGHSLTEATTAGAERFKSPIVPIGSNAPVGGVEALAPGTYSFTCRVHPFMAGTLVVD